MTNNSPVDTRLEQFKLHTRFGLVAVKVQRDNHFYITARMTKESGYGEESPLPITIRGKTFNHFSMHASVMPNGMIDGRTYDFDGNTLIFVSERPENSYFKTKAVYMSDGTDAAKKAFYEEVILQLNSFYANNNNKGEIHFIWARQAENKRLADIQGLKDENLKLAKNIADNDQKIYELEKLAPKTFV